MSDKLARPSIQEYWDERYQQLDINRSGHRDLPLRFNTWLYRRKRDCLQRLLRRAQFSLAGKRVLELGVGTGVYVADWVRGGAQVTGIDLSARAVSALQTRYPEHRFACGDFSDPAFASRLDPPFDLVTAADVLYYLADDATWSRTLRTVAESLSAGGLFLIIEQFRHGETWERGVITWRNLQAYTDTLHATGFEIVARVPVFFTMVQVCDEVPARLCRVLDAAWDWTYPWMQRLPGVMGPLTYAIDSTLGSVLAEGPSMEAMLCRLRR
ncbi:MAG: class I SAM-dependent methyltransferase [Pseudomonadales bacterium]|nr:class I SAM-dependent methyltransferase [Pseudomonadales bacterium]